MLFSQVNTFQVVLAADQQMTFVLFIYGDIQWGDRANIGFSAGDSSYQVMYASRCTDKPGVEH